ncbi:succinate dehydrogenase hydrophobic membrane anchor subunit [Sanguibacter sp. A247]|uniref:succinate dehydrogenase hydrophobic membrane anchor subunit n=1 Tax=unclassified Sanguibacter TaxID=2645534 RepID=UPI003FD7F60F
MTVTTPTIAAPRSPFARRKTTRGNFELYGWVFMRLSGVVLVGLIFTHLFVNLLAGEGIKAIDFAFVAGKWASPVWQVVDLIMLWLAMMHGTNGVRTIINDYAEKDRTRGILKTLLYAAFVIVVITGTLVIFTFEPCPAGADPAVLADFCKRL